MSASGPETGPADGAARALWTAFLARRPDAAGRFYERACRALGREPGDDMPLVCERFRVVYCPEPAPSTVTAPRIVPRT